MNKKTLFSGLLIGISALFSSQQANAQCSFTPNYSENFSGYIPSCWTEAQGRLGFTTILSGTSSSWLADGFLNSGSTGSARVNIFGTTGDEWLISPIINLGTSAYQLEFDAGLTDFSGSGTDLMGPDDTLAVVISTDTGLTWSTANIVKLYVAGNQPSNSGESIVIDLSAYSGNIKVGFYAASTISNTDYNVYIDNFAVNPLASCPKPTSLSASAITANSASFNWTEAGTATSWEFEYDTTGFTLGTGTASVVSTDSVNVTALMSNTAYDVYVRAICAVGDSSAWVGPISFTSLCGTFSSPFTEDFNSFVPDCWEEAGNGTPNTGVTSIGSGDWLSGNFLNTSANGGGVKINLYDNVDKEWIISPTIDLSVGGPLELVISAGVTNWNTSAADNMGSDDEVLVLISEDNMTSWDTLYTWNAANQPPTLGANYRISLSGYTTNNNIVAIWATDGSVNDSEDYDFHIGSFELRTVPACLAPTALASSLISLDSVSIGWTENNTSTEWQISYGISGFTVGSGNQIITTSNPDTLVGLSLMNNTTYDFYVRSICSSSDTSAWSVVNSLTTPCAFEVAPFSESFDAASLPSCWNRYQATGSGWVFGTPGFSWNTSGCSGSTPADHTGNSGNYAALDFSVPDAGVVLELPTVDVTALTVPYLSFYFTMCGSGYSPLNILFVETFDGSNWSIVDSIQQGTTGWEEFKFVMSPYVYNTNLLKVRFRAENGGSTLVFYGDMAIDDVSIVEAPTCPDPSNQASFNITANTADVTWMDNSTAASWLVEWDTAGYAAGTARNSTVATNDSITLTGLSQITSYDWTVRAICAIGDSSNAINGSFTTPATCPAPTALSVNDISFDVVELNWTNNSTATSWEIEYDTVGFTLGTGNTIITTTNPDTISGLMSNTTYSWYVRAICSSSDSSTWTGPNTFTTLCSPFGIGYLEDFSSYVPGCWSEAKGQLTTNTVFTSTTSSFWIADGFLNNGSSGSARMNIYSTGRYEWLISPSIDLGNGSGFTSTQVEFDAGLTDFSGSGIDLMGPDDTLSVVISTDNGQTWSSSNVLKLYDVASPPSNLGERVVLDLSGYTGVIKIGFYATSTISNTDYNVYIDNFEVTQTPIPYYPIGTINTEDTLGVADSLGLICYTSGTVAGVDLDGNNGISFTIVDLSGNNPEGMNIFNFNDVSGYVVNEGDSIMVRGEIQQFNGLTELFPDSIMIISTGASLPAHALVTALDESTESALIRMENLTVTNVPSGSSKNIGLTDGTNNFVMRVDADTDVLDSLTFNVGDQLCYVNGIGGQFDNSNPYTSGYQIFPMRYTDVVFTPTVDLGPDTIVCDTAGFMLDAGVFASYMWNTGDTTQMITPNDTISQYIVTVMDINGCSNTDTVDVTVTICVGINEVAKNNAIISFFPNPNNGQFKLEVKNVNTSLSSTIEVIGINGQIVYTESLNINGSLSKDINLNVEKGLYFVRLINENGVKVEKLIIK